MTEHPRRVEWFPSCAFPGRNTHLMGTASLTDADRAQLSARADEFHAALGRGRRRRLGHVPRRPARARPPGRPGRTRHHRPGPPVGARRAAEGRGLRRAVPRTRPGRPGAGGRRAGGAPLPDEGRRAAGPGVVPGRASPSSTRRSTRRSSPAGRRTVAAQRRAAPWPASDGGAAAGAAPRLRPQDYEFLRVLGRGMFGEVWLARKKPSGIEKAVKILLQAGRPATRPSASCSRWNSSRTSGTRTCSRPRTSGSRTTACTSSMELADGTLRGRLKQCRRQGQPGIPPDELLGYICGGGRGARLPAPAADHPPRREAGQHPAAARAREGRRLRAGAVPGGRSLAADETSRARRRTWPRRCGAARAARRATSTAWRSPTPSCARATRRCGRDRSTT